MPKEPCTYIMASYRHGTLYTGSTNDIIRRAWEHKNNFGSKFVTKYRIYMLVYYEQHDDMITAIERELEIKKWRRARKIQLIERFNYSWRDLYYDIAG